MPPRAMARHPGAITTRRVMAARVGAKTREPELEPDREMISAYMNAVYPYAGTETYLNVRAFQDGVKGGTPLFVQAIRADAPDIVDIIYERARQAANAPGSYVFCFPVCTFRRDNGARLEDLAQGLVIVAELDDHPTESR